MGCTLQKKEEFTERSLSPNIQRGYLLRYALQNARYVKYIGIPQLSLDEQNKLLISSREYMDFIDKPGQVHHFTEFQARNPFLFSTFFKNVPTQLQCSRSTEDARLNGGDYNRHLQISKTVIKNCVIRLTTGGSEILEESLRRVGAYHAERWVCSKDLLFFEDSFMWSLERSNGEMSHKVKMAWRKVIRFILHNIIIGMNNHYEKLNFVLNLEQTGCCCLERRIPRGVDYRSHDSLKKLAAYVRSQADS